MVQKNEALAREANRISTQRPTTQEDYLTIAETAIPVNTTEQAWIFELGDETRVGRKATKLVNTLVIIMNWLNHLGSGKIDDSCLESRHNIHHNFRTNGIRF